MARDREDKVEHHLVKESKRLGYLCYKFTSPGNSGVPDRVIIGHNQTIFIETKAPGKKPRVLQDRVIGRMKEHGANVYVVDSVEAVDELLAKLTPAT